MAIYIRVEERFRVGDQVALPLGGGRGLVGTVIKRTSPLVYYTTAMRYLIEFRGLDHSLAEVLLRRFCECDSCIHIASRIRRKNATGPALETLVAEGRRNCKSDGKTPSGDFRLWLGKGALINATGENRLPYFTV